MPLTAAQERTAFFEDDARAFQTVQLFSCKLKD
jgi:hypothetical protein